MSVNGNRAGASVQERQTRQKQVIKAVLEQERRPLTPREIYDLARMTLPTLGMATVYRTIKRLVEDVQLLPVDIPGIGSLYELADMAPHHAHFLCTNCNKVFEMNAPVAKPSTDLPKGFVVQNYEILLKGRCPGCEDD